MIWNKKFSNIDAKWYAISAKDSVAEVDIYDEIGFFGITASDFVKEIRGIDAELIRVRLNTPGGDVFDGLAIYNALRSHKAKVEVVIDGLAASMGSVIALAADEVKMADNAFYMIHNPWAVAIGDSQDMRKLADSLDKISGSMVEIYKKNSSLTEEQIIAAMDEETWYTAKEAQEAGFVSEVLESDEDFKASFDLGKFRNSPMNKNAVSEATEEQMIEEKDYQAQADMMRRRLRLAESEQ